MSAGAFSPEGQRVNNRLTENPASGTGGAGTSGTPRRTARVSRACPCPPGTAFRRARGRRQGGFILFEVVLSLALLLMGLTYIGAQIQNTYAAAYETEELTRILMLVEMKLAELDTGLINLDEEADNEVEGDFTLRIPDYGWRMRLDPTATEGLRAITLDILYAPRLDLDEEFDVDNAEVVHTVYTLRAVPATVDLQTDFGFNEEALVVLGETSPFEEDWTDFDLPGAARDRSMEELIEWLTAMLTASGQSIDQLASVLPKEFGDLLELQGAFEGFDSAEDAESLDSQGSALDEPLPGKGPGAIDDERRGVGGLP